MSEQEKNSRHAIGGEPSVVVVKQQPTESRHKPYRPTELPDEPSDRLHKRSKAPAVPCTSSLNYSLKDAVAEEFKDVTHDINTPIDAKPDEKLERKKQEHVSTGISKHQASKMLSTSSHVPEVTKPTETIVLATMELEPVLKVIPSQPIPAEIKSVASEASVALAKEVKKSDEESITEDIAELPTLETTKISDWSDDQEAGGLPRSESRSSRVSRAVRQLFCCGVAYSPASEEDVSTARFGSGI